MTSLVVGLGEIGQALFNVLYRTYGEDVWGYDLKRGESTIVERNVYILHICIPYTEGFIGIVEDYISTCNPKYVVIHSSVPVGTTSQINGNCFHSPVRGKHPDIEKGLLAYAKYLSFDNGGFYDAEELADYFFGAGIEVKIVPDTKTTELGKLLALARYGVYIAFAKEQEKICERFGVSYHKAVTDFEATRNEGLDKVGTPALKQPILYPFGEFTSGKNYVEGHCTVEDMEILLKQYATPLLFKAYEIDRNTKIWGSCNIYPTAKIGKGCSVGNGTEIGHNVVVGNNVRIGAQCFIPEGVTIEDDCFIAPKVTFSNDKRPPSGKENWGTILVKKGAAIGMGAIILPNVTIGENALVGAGAIVTKDVPPGEVWYGTAAYSHGKREDVDDE